MLRRIVELLRAIRRFFMSVKVIDSGNGGSGVVIINNLDESDYNKQRDNKRYPLETCGPTSMAMALLQAGHSIPIKLGEDPADTITTFLTSERYYEKMYRILGTQETQWKPFNIHALLTEGVNELLGEKVSRFRTDWDFLGILFNIVRGGGAVLSGDFTLPDGRELGHMVSLAGFRTKQRNIMDVRSPSEIDLKLVESFIIDDPYGDWHTGYNDHHGNNIEFSPTNFNNIFRVQKNMLKKWAHLVRAGGK